MPSPNPYTLNIFPQDGGFGFNIVRISDGEITMSGHASPVVPDYPEFEQHLRNRHDARFLNRVHAGQALSSSGIYMPEMNKFVYIQKY